MKPETIIPRWTAWARALAGRHGRRHERIDHLSLQLAHPRALARSVQQRWFFCSQSVQPRISLAVQPVLRASFWRQGERVLREHRTDRTDRSDRSDRQLLRERLEASREVERVLPGGPALERVFERLREPGRVLGRPSGRQERAAEAAVLARTLAAQGRREEKPLPGGPAARVLRTAEPVGREERRSPESRQPEMPGWGSPAAARNGFAVPAGAAPSINVEALTDQVMRQIDRRVGAWRERTGGF